MKRTFTYIIAILLTSVLGAQTPAKISYQAVIRNSSDQLIANQDVGMQISILQGSAGGTAIYIETHKPKTNSNGLVSIEIGGGTVVSGNFQAINWADGPFFVKTETDPDGGNNYTITGVSQLLSVPYALHAKTAESIAGTTPGGGTRYVGELYGGGVVFWVDNTGKHGLIVSMVTLSTTQAWSNIANNFTNKTNDWNGASNTQAIITQSGHATSAARLCDDYTNADYGTGVYDDWYLPSMGEANLLWVSFYQVQKALIIDGNPLTMPIERLRFWTSTEYDNSYAWTFPFGSGYINYNAKSTDYAVRAIRAF